MYEKLAQEEEFTSSKTCKMLPSQSHCSEKPNWDKFRQNSKEFMERPTNSTGNKQKFL
jgi:hypothetical protein